MILFDTHAHFNVQTLAQEQLERAIASDFTGILAMGGSAEMNSCAIKLAKENPDFVCVSLGLDRDLALEYADSPTAIPELRKLLQATAQEVRVVAVGEIGLDYREDTSELEKAAQRKLFSQQLQLAAELKLPVSIHCRGAADDVLSIVAEYGSKELMAENRLGVVHCFTEDIDFATKAYGMGLYFGISGIVTFRNADLLRSTVSKLPIERILIETDCPYLSPVPMRGKPCEPAFARYTAECVAGLHGLDIEAFGEISTANARKLFAL